VGTSTAAPWSRTLPCNLDFLAWPLRREQHSVRRLAKARGFLHERPPATNGTIYFSFALKVLTLTGASLSGGFFAGFNNSIGTQGPHPSLSRPRLSAHPSGALPGVAKNRIRIGFGQHGFYNLTKYFSSPGAIPSRPWQPTRMTLQTRINPEPDQRRAPFPPSRP